MNSTASLQTAINDAFERYLDPCLSPQAERAIALAHGIEAAAHAKVAYHALVNVPVDWRTATIDTALPLVHDVLDSRYPWLSQRARANICGAFVMTWK